MKAEVHTMNKLLLTTTVLDCLIDRIKTNHFALYHEYQQKGIEWAYSLPLRTVNWELVKILAQSLHCDEFDYCIVEEKIIFSTDYQCYKSITEIPIKDLDIYFNSILTNKVGD